MSRSGVVLLIIVSLGVTVVGPALWLWLGDPQGVLRIVLLAVLVLTIAPGLLRALAELSALVRGFMDGGTWGYGYSKGGVPAPQPELRRKEIESGLEPRRPDVPSYIGGGCYIGWRDMEASSSMIADHSIQSGWIEEARVIVRCTGLDSKGHCDRFYYGLSLISILQVCSCRPRACGDVGGDGICRVGFMLLTPCTCGREVCDTFKSGCYETLCPDHLASTEAIRKLFSD